MLMWTTYDSHKMMIIRQHLRAWDDHICINLYDVLVLILLVLAREKDIALVAKQDTIPVERTEPTVAKHSDELIVS